MNYKKLKSLFFLVAIFIPLAALPQTMTLQQCINEALQKNVQLNITKRTNDIYSVNLTQAKYAQYPSLNGNANQGFSFGKSLNPITYQYVNQNIATNAFSLTSTFVIFEGRQLTNTILQDRALYEAGKLDIETYKNTITLGVTSAYLQILLDNELIKIADSTIKSDKRQIDITKVMVAAGSVPQLNLYQVQSQLAADNLTLTNNKNQLALDRLTLEQLMEKPDTAAFDVDKPELPDPPAQIDSVPPSKIYTQSVENQPQVKSTEKKLDGAKYGIDIAKGAAYPRLLLNSSISTNYSSNRNLSTSQIILQNENIGYLQSNPSELVYGNVPTQRITNSTYPFFNQFGDNIGEGFIFSLTIPIFNNYLIRANIQQAVINKDVAFLNDQYTRDQYRKTIEQSYTDFTGTHNQYVSSLEALRTETEAYNTMVVKYKGGAVNASELILEKNKFVTSQSTVAQAKYNFIFKQKVLDFYQGKQITL